MGFLMKFFLFIIIIVIYSFIACNQNIDGIAVKKFSSKREYFKEGRYHAFGQENRKKSYLLAEHYLKEALKFSPNDRGTINLLANVYRMNNQIHLAENLYKTSLQKNPESLRTRYTLGHLYLSTNNYNAAKEILLSCIEMGKAPFFPCYMMLASTYMQTQETDKAIDIYKKQIELYKARGTSKEKVNPAAGTVHLKLAEIFMSQKKFKEAYHHSTEAKIYIPDKWPSKTKVNNLLAQLKKELNISPAKPKKKFAKVPKKSKKKIKRKRKYTSKKRKWKKKTKRKSKKKYYKRKKRKKKTK